MDQAFRVVREDPEPREPEVTQDLTADADGRVMGESFGAVRRPLAGAIGPQIHEHSMALALDPAQRRREQLIRRMRLVTEAVAAQNTRVHTGEARVAAADATAGRIVHAVATQAE